MKHSTQKRGRGSELPKGELKLPLIPHGWDSWVSAWLAAHLRAFCLQRGGQGLPHAAPGSR